ncbi:saccharopine dehydrogenase family protein [Dethiobacter alkaliphilus]|uniref:Saccharopine dehydrogenase n=1 Tax=Dethiobacter alkaliphilus AHT 1 TaxID=555088 RepID=C0GD72_DETAL|nr:saccharopine dehydrogenase NADP-binding domain-containing protein [Dethiobacter alkaliphilus]EEG78593.1 Saccharopine dehydrogenase [Dethiobacter alkaliphilus AHT 1]
MKVIFFGGTGSMGQRAVSELCSFSEIKEVTVTARTREKYETLLNQIKKGNEKLKYLEFDINSAEDLAGIIRGHDVAASAIGPFYRYEKRLALAAVTAGADYVSICDDFDAAQQVFELDGFVRERHQRVLTGVGWTPGLSSFMARAGADSLDTVEKINVSWAGNSDDSVGAAVILHVLHIFYGLVPSFMDGELKMVPAGSGKEVVSFPGVLDRINVYNVGHPEPVTMPRYFSGVKEVTLKGGINEDVLNKLALLVGRLGLSKSQTTRDMLAAMLRKSLPLLRKTIGAASEHSGIRVDISGTLNGENKQLVYSAAGPMDILTGVPMAVAVRELAKGNIKQVGVFAPEAPGVLDPSVFFDELEKRGVQIIREEKKG